MTKKYISAGAGSGKTYTITTHVAQLVKEKKIKPEQVIMTTFTKAAAQELREKVKKELAKMGLFQEARQMEQALIGTVHSVAHAFLKKYWYILGIMPDVSAIEEDELNMYRDHSLRGLLNSKERSFMFDYAEKFQLPYELRTRKSGINYEFWKKDLCSVLEYIQWYSIADEQLDDSMEMTESVIQCLSSDGIGSIQSLAQGAMEKIRSVIDASPRPGKVMKELRQWICSRGNVLNDEELRELFVRARKYKDLAEVKAYNACLLALKFLNEENSEKHRQYASIIFSLAKRWQSMYRGYKDKHHLIDFNDMETMFLQLLQNSEVRQDIRSRFTHFFVDEFQDSNPIQVRIFQQLSELLDTCYVGDKKQAIYGFRGSDTELTDAVADSMSERATLKYSYRSVKPLVEFSNTVFTHVFSGMDKDDVMLSMPSSNGNLTEVEKPLRVWPYDNDTDLALQIQQLILSGKYKAKDIAVLARYNDGLDSLAEKLHLLHVPVCREFDDIKDSRTGRLLKALLTLVAMPSNSLARAEVAYLSEPGYHVTHLIEERLAGLAQEDRKGYLKDVPILRRLDGLCHFKSSESQEYARNLLGYQSISALVESLVIELDLYSVVQGWENALAEETNLQVFVDLARKYEDYATKLVCPATVTGFIDFFTSRKQKGAANEEGVRLYTYYKAKGLEWKVVVMLSLDYDPSDAERIATRCMLGCHCHREKLPTMLQPNPPMRISLVPNVYEKEKDMKSVLVSCLQRHPLWEKVRRQEIGEAARLLYVGVTRAREVLILAPKQNKDSLDFSWFRSVGIDDVLGLGRDFCMERVDEKNLLIWPENNPSKVHDIASGFSPLNRPLFLRPSHSGSIPHDICTVNDEEHRMLVRYQEDQEAAMGNFIHQVFCCCDNGISLEQIVKLRGNYGFTEANMPHPEQLLEAWDFLVKTLEIRYGVAVKRHHEKPFRHFDREGRIVSGYMDLVWETEDGYVVVDYKTCPGNYNQVFQSGSGHYAGRYGNQLDCYQRALEAAGEKKVRARVIYYPVTRFVVEIK